MPIPSRFLLAPVLCGLASTLTAQTTRCVLPAGAGGTYVAVSGYSTRSAYDDSRHRATLGADGRFTKVELNPYLEYGLTQRLTGIANLFVAHTTYRDNAGSSSATGLENPELALRYDVSRLHGLGALVCGLQLGVKLPAYSGGTPALGLNQTDVEARAISLYGFTMAPGKYGYADVELAYRYRAGAPADEIRLDASLGVPLSTSVQLLTQLFTTTGLRNQDQIIAAVNPAAASDYDLYKAQLSLVTQLAPRVRLQTGGFAHVLGRNTGAGGGAIISLWTQL